MEHITMLKDMEEKTKSPVRRRSQHTSSSSIPSLHDVSLVIPETRSDTHEEEDGRRSMEGEMGEENVEENEERDGEEEIIYGSKDKQEEIIHTVMQVSQMYTLLYRHLCNTAISELRSPSDSPRFVLILSPY